MYFKSTDFTNDMEILVTPANLVTFSGTVLAANVTDADKDGKKYVAAGSLIDVDGNVVTQTGTTGSETLSTTPVGILYKTIDVTNGDEPGSLIVEGYVRADRVLDGWAAAAVTLIKKALPNVKFR
jgi:hypothetical protein